MEAHLTLICVPLNGIRVKTSQVIVFHRNTEVAGEDSLAWHRCQEDDPVCLSVSFASLEGFLLRKFCIALRRHRSSTNGRRT